MKEYPLNNNYLVSEDGKIYSKRLKKELTPKINWDGYHRIQIWKNNKCKYISWHRVVAETFLPNPNNYPVVNHKNGIKDDNRVENLEWCTQQENIQHSWRKGFSKSNRPIDVLTLDGEYIKTFRTAKEGGEFANCHPSGITKCARGHLKQCKGYKWRYSETSNDYHESE